jgi:nicotinate-nucleotide adenylyltransferase
MEDFELAEVRFIPCRQPAHRTQPLASSAQRRILLQLAIAEQPGFILDERELLRDGPSYMVDSLDSLRTEFGKEIPLCLLLGSDAFTGLPQWHRWQELPELAHLVVMRRPGSTEFNSKTADITFGWQRLRSAAGLSQQPAGGILYWSCTQLDISATRIRELLAAGKSPRYLVPETVLSYICDHNLYGSPPSNIL